MVTNYNFATSLIDAARLDPDKTYVIDTAGDSYTFGDVAALVAAAGDALARRGVTRGDRIIVRLPNCIDFIVNYFALLGLGAQVLPLNPAASSREVRYVADDAGARAAIVTDHDPLHDDKPVPALWSVTDLVADRRDGAPHFAPVTVPADETALILYTSGSTGAPKGVEHTHLSLMLVPVFNVLMTSPGEDVQYGVLPLYHVYGLSEFVHATVLRRQSVVLRESFSTADAFDVIEQHGVTLLCGVPTMFHAMINADHSGRDFSSVRQVASGGAPMSPENIARIQQVFPNAAYVEGWGMTETGASGTNNGAPGEFRHGSVGRAALGAALRIVNPQGVELTPGPDNVGEILFQSPVVMKGYVGRPDLTAEAVQDGWLRTGDLGWLDEDGYLYIAGRSKDLIIRGGFNVYPKEVEDVLESHPTVAAAAVVGRPDPHYGEEIVAFVLPTVGRRADVAELLEFCHEQLAPYKCPRVLLVKQEFPHGPSGKVDKLALRAEAGA